MNIVNKTTSQVYYSTQAPGIGDCGTINPGDSAYIPYETKWGVFDVSIAPKSSGTNCGTFEFKNVNPGAVVTIATSVEL